MTEPEIIMYDPRIKCIDVSAHAISKWCQKYINEDGFLGMIIDIPFVAGVQVTIDKQRYDIYLLNPPQFCIDPRRSEEIQIGNFDFFIPKNLITNKSNFIFHGLIYNKGCNVVPRKFKIDLIDISVYISNNKYISGELDLFPDRALQKIAA